MVEQTSSTTGRYKLLMMPIWSDWAAAIADNAVYDPDGGVGVPDGNELPTAYGLSQITLHFWDTYQGADVPFAPGACPLRDSQSKT